MPLVPESVPVGLVVELELPELGLTDLAWVTDIADCPEIESRDSGCSAGGSVVTATFHHCSGDVIDLTLGSKSSTLAPPETIGTTSNHPFWSVDRQEYVQAGQLDVGERVLTFSGDTKRVVTKLPRPGPQPVYNLEVHAEHVYFVGEDGLLVHNTRSYLDESDLARMTIRSTDDFGGNASHYAMQGIRSRPHTGLNRPGLNKSTRQAIANMDTNGHLYDAASGKLAAGYDWGHIHGFENKHMLDIAHRLDMDASSVHAFVNAHPHHFEIQPLGINRSRINDALTPDPALEAEMRAFLRAGGGQA